MRKLWQRIAAEFGLNEVLLCLSLLLIGGGLWWSDHPAAALIITGLAILWLVMPSRAPFIHSATPSEPRRRSS